MKIPIKEYSLKIPSSSIVTHKNIWEILKIISKTGNGFSEEDILKHNSPINEKNLFRILAYLKYLGFIYEKREKEFVDGKEKTIQRWFEKEKKEINEFFFLLRDNREEESKKIFKEIVKKHDLYLAIREELIKDKLSSTIIELKDYLRKKILKKSVGYYNHGVKFILNLLFFCDLITRDGNIFRLKEQEFRESFDDEKETRGISEKTKIQLEDNKYIISIIGKGHNFEFPINEIADVEDVKTILEIIKKKLNK